MALTMPDLGGGSTSEPDSDGGSTDRDPVSTIADPTPTEYGEIGQDDPPEPDPEPTMYPEPETDSEPEPTTSESDPETTSSSPAGQSASTDEGAEENRLAAMLSRLGSTGGSEDVAVGSTATSIISDVANNPDIFQENLEGAREQLEEFREDNPVSEIVDDALNETENETSPTEGDGGGLLASVREYGTLAVAGVVAVGATALVVAGGD